MRIFNKLLGQTADCRGFNKAKGLQDSLGVCIGPLQMAEAKACV